MRLYDRHFSLNELALAGDVTAKRLRYWVDDTETTQVQLLTDADREAGRHRRLGVVDAFLVSVTARLSDSGMNTMPAWFKSMELFRSSIEKNPPLKEFATEFASQVLTLTWKDRQAVLALHVVTTDKQKIRFADYCRDHHVVTTVDLGHEIKRIIETLDIELD